MEYEINKHAFLQVKHRIETNNRSDLFSENHIRHIPVVDGKIIGMISIVDVVRAVGEQQSGEVNKLIKSVY